MKNDLSRREFLKLTAKGLVATLVSPAIITASPSLYKTPTTRKDLYNIPENHLLARMIFGEGRNCITSEKLAIGYTAVNRLNDGKKYNGEGSMTNVLLKKYRGDDQYDCFCDTITKLEENFKQTLDPIKYDSKAWGESLALADYILIGNSQKLNQGQTSYVTKNRAEELKNKKFDNWFKKSIPITINSPDTKLFKHQFVMDP